MLGLSSSEAAVMPDSAFILAAWDAWSDASVSKLVGDFAFLLWDEREQTLWAARDQIGQRVLYYHSSPARVALASSPAALLALEDVHPRLNERKLGELLVDIRDSETTCVEGILRLPPSHVMRVSQQAVTRRRYWSFEDCSQLTFRSGEECSDAFREVLGRAVRDRVRSRQRVAVALSAGLDSSSIAALAATTLAEQGGRLSAYHAAPAVGPLARPRDGWILDESDDVVSIARMHASVDLSILRGPWSMPLDEAVTIFPVLFAPVRNVLNVPWYLDIYRRARADGANVLLTGGWGNFTISASGDRWLHEIARSGRLLRLIREVKAFATARQRSVWDVVKGEVLLPVIPPGPAAVFNRLRGKSSRLPIWRGRTHPYARNSPEACVWRSRVWRTVSTHRPWIVSASRRAVSRPFGRPVICSTPRTRCERGSTSRHGSQPPIFGLCVSAWAFRAHSCSGAERTGVWCGTGCPVCCRVTY